MGAQQSSGSNRKDDEKYQIMIKSALEQQRKMYEAKLLQERQNTEARRNENEERISLQNTNYAPLYPNLQQIPAANVNMQPSTSTALTALRHTYTSNTAIQNKPQCITTFDLQPSAPTAPEASTSSQQKQRANTKKKQKYQAEYQCPSCKKNRLSINIFQCQQGHSSCNLCKIKAVKCGICQSVLTNTRNIELERIIANLGLNSEANNNNNNVERVDCPNTIDGCRLSFRQEHLPAHLKACVFREMECPLLSAINAQCFWRGKINHLQAHFLEFHPDQMGAGVDKEMIFDLINNHHVVHHVAMGNFNFLIHLKLESILQTLYMGVQLIGSTFSASKWTYEFHVYNKNEPRRKYSYVDVCHSNMKPFVDVTKDSNCAALPMQYASTFCNNNKITYKFYIKREESKRLRPNHRDTSSVQSET